MKRMAGIPDQDHFIPSYNLPRAWTCEIGEFSPLSFWHRSDGILYPLVILLGEIQLLVLELDWVAFVP